MTTKLEKLLLAVEAEKAKVKARVKAEKIKKTEDIVKIIIESGAGELPRDFLLTALQKVVVDYKTLAGGILGDE